MRGTALLLEQRSEFGAKQLRSRGAQRRAGRTRVRHAAASRQSGELQSTCAISLAELARSVGQHSSRREGLVELALRLTADSQGRVAGQADLQLCSLQGIPQRHKRRRHLCARRGIHFAASYSASGDAHRSTPPPIATCAHAAHRAPRIPRCSHESGILHNRASAAAADAEKGSAALLTPQLLRTAPSGSTPL